MPIIAINFYKTEFPTETKVGDSEFEFLLGSRPNVAKHRV